MRVTIDQIKAARGLKNWTQMDLANAANISKDTIRNIESGKLPHQQTLIKIVRAFEIAGIEFIERGVRHSAHTVKILEGQEGFLEFYEDVYHTLKVSENRKVYVSNVDERKFVKWQGEQLTEHIERVLRLKASYKILIKHGDTYFPASSYAEYRWLPDGIFYSVPTYMYGSKVALIIFSDSLRIYILNEPEISEAHRKQFEEAWKNSQEPDNHE